MNKSFWWLIIVLVVVAVGGFYLRSSKNQDQGTAVEEGVVVEEETLVPATGNIDDAVQAILGETANEELAPEDSDTSLTEVDNVLIDSFGEALNESQF